MPEYFSHDYDAREDEKVIDMMAEMGWAGYGLFWAVVELLYKNGGRMRTQYNRIAFALNSHPDQIQQLIENYELFQIRKGFFYSKSVNKRLKKRNEKSEVARANAYKGWEKRHAKALQDESGSNAIKESKQIKESIDSKLPRQFYQNEFIKAGKSENKKMKVGYFKFIGTVWNENGYKNDLDRPVEHILKLSNQLSFDQYIKLSVEAKKRGVNLVSKLKRIINNPGYTTGKQSLFLLLEDWIEREPIQGTNH